MIKKTIMICLIVLMGITLFACSPKEEEVTLTSGDVSVTFTKPAGWETKDSASVIFHIKKGSSNSILRRESFDVETLDEAVTKAKDNFSSQYKSVQDIEDAVDITVDGRDAKKFVFQGAISTQTMKYQNVLFFVGDDVYALSYSSIKSSYDEHIDDFDLILDSIHFE